ncbi:MAG: metallophosphoesterase [Tissierellia bacterium]|nr:metallophosphoesterase [Tissierellia bacterium]
MIFAIGDLHFDHSKKKPMDIFGPNWIDHEEKIMKYWKDQVGPQDVVLLVGDISWGLKLKDAVNDLHRIHQLPGQKIISKGNHDYWWSSLGKMKGLGFHSLHFLNNNSYTIGDIGICGTRGWAPRDSQEFSQQDEKIYLREVGRLKLSLDSVKQKEKIAMIHYPPFNQDFTPNEFSKMLADYNVRHCIYGHLHGPGHRYVFNGELLGVKYQCVASDYVDFKLQKIGEGLWSEK